MTPKPLILRWTEPLPIELPRLGIECELKPPTRAQMRRYYALDESSPEAPTPEQLDKLRGEAVAIFAEGTDIPADKLTADEELDILWAVLAIHNGHDPADAVALADLLKKKAVLGALAIEAAASAPSTTTRSPLPPS
jgi:hypothetical protein